MSDDPNEDIDPGWGYVSPGESRVPASVALLGAMALQIVLPEKLSVGPGWLVPGIEAVLLFASSSLARRV